MNGRQAGISRRDLVTRLRQPGGDARRTFRAGSWVDRTRAMRSPARPGNLVKAVESPPSAAVIALNRMGYGPRPGDIEAFNALGSTDAARLAAYVDQQLQPELVDDSACDARIMAAGFTTLGRTQAQLWQDHVESGVGWYDRMRPLYEIERLTFLRAVHSRRQLLEVLAEFWHSHFNVYGWDYWVGPLWSHWDRDVIRANALGNFELMLRAVARSPCMLYYLDNYTSSSAGPNENWSRELCELHTLGAENYLGVRRQSDVPLDGAGWPVGYVDDDVFEITRCFTGWTFDFDTGLFEYRGDWHDRFQKNVIGQYVPANQADQQDGLDVLWRLSRHHGTARHIARKLCRRLISDEPPQAVVDAAAEVFFAARDDSDQIAQVVRTILLSDEFLATWGEKIKRPFEIAVGAMRAAGASFSFALSEDAADDFLWNYDQAGQPLFSWRAPNGYSDVKDDWQSATPRVFSWRLCAWLMDAEDDGANHLLDVVGQTPPHLRTANQLVDFWIHRALGRQMPSADRRALVDFMAQGHNPDYGLPLDADGETRERLRAMVGLIFMSPTFLWR